MKATIFQMVRDGDPAWNASGPEATASDIAVAPKAKGLRCWGSDWAAVVLCDKKPKPDVLAKLLGESVNTRSI